jgi:hypothetical protein
VKKALNAAIRKMDRAGISLLALMFGMHNAGSFLALSAACGMTDYDDYAEIQSLALQPGSPEGQRLRLEASYMGLFRDLMKQSRQESRVRKNIRKRD